MTKDPKKSNTSKVDYSPNIQQPIYPVNVQGGDGPGSANKFSIGLGDLISPDTQDRIAPEDREIIDAYMGLHSEVKARLDSYDQQLDAILADLNIPYDPKRHPDLTAAHTHICGRPGASPVITYKDIQSRWNLEKAQTKTVLGVPAALDDMNEMTSTEMEANSASQVDKMVRQMLIAAAKQIILYVLEFSMLMFKPLEKVKFVNAIPKFINRGIQRVKGSPANQDPLTIGTFVDDVLVNEEGEVTSDDLAQAGGGYINSIKEVAQNIVDGLPPECLQHTSTWNKALESLVRDTKYAPAYYAKRSNIMMQERLESINKVAALGIPHGTIANINGTALTYNNPLPEEYLRARADGSTKISAFGTGLVDSLNQIKDTFIPKMEQVLKNLLEDPTILCCLIRNIIAMAKMDELKRVLLYIQAILQLYRNLLALDISTELARLGNLILDIVNSLLQSIFSLYTRYFYKKFAKFALTKLDLEKLVTRECEPWNDLLNLVIELLDDMLRKIYEYLSGFFININLDINRISEQTGKTANLAKIDRLLEIINKILQFTAAWQACIESKQDPRVILSLGRRVDVSGTGIQLAPAGPKPAKDEFTGGIKAAGGGAQDAGPQVELPADSPLSSTGVQILLTNFLNVPQQTAKEIMDDIGNCSCDKSLTSEELTQIQKYFKG